MDLWLICAGLLRLQGGPVDMLAGVLVPSPLEGELSWLGALCGSCASELCYNGGKSTGAWVFQRHHLNDTFAHLRRNGMRKRRKPDEAGISLIIALI